MMILALVVALSGLVAQRRRTPQEGKQEPKVPKDSVRLVVSGCLKGRVLAVSDVRQEDTRPARS